MDLIVLMPWMCSLMSCRIQALSDALERLLDSWSIYITTELKYAEKLLMTWKPCRREVAQSILTSQHHVGITMADEIESVSDRVGACCAGSGCRMIGPQQAVLHAHHTSSHVGQQPWHHKRAQPAGEKEE